MILINRLPSMTARKAYRARERMALAFRLYFEAGNHDFGSILVQNRYNSSVRNRVSVEDIARFEIGNSLALLINTAPAVFWVQFYLYSKPNVLQECRTAVDLLISDTEGIYGIRKTIDITKVKRDCPVLTSALQEVLRQRTLGAQVWQVMQDTMLDDKYLLKKGATLIIPSLVIHTDPAVWGPMCRILITSGSQRETKANLRSRTPKRSELLEGVPRCVQGVTSQRQKSWPRS